VTYRKTREVALGQGTDTIVFAVDILGALP